MKIQLTIEVDDLEEVCDEILEMCEAAQENGLAFYIGLMPAPASYEVGVQAVTELPATGRPRKEDT